MHFYAFAPLRRGESTTTDHRFIFVRNVPSGFKKIRRRDPTGVPNALFGYIGRWSAPEHAGQLCDRPALHLGCTALKAVEAILMELHDGWLRLGADRRDLRLSVHGFSGADLGL